MFPKAPQVKFQFQVRRETVKIGVIVIICSLFKHLPLKNTVKHLGYYLSVPFS